MRLVYEPEGGEAEEFSFKPEQILNLESEAVEEAGGTVWRDWDGFMERLQYGNTRAMRALLWMFLRRKNPKLSFASLVFKMSEARLSYDDEELAAMEAAADEAGEPIVEVPEEPEGKGEGGDSDTSS